MYVCICNGVTDSQIKRALEVKDIKTLGELNYEFGMGQQCGSCADIVRNIYNESTTEETRSIEVLSHWKFSLKKDIFFNLNPLPKILSNP